MKKTEKAPRPMSSIVYVVLLPVRRSGKPPSDRRKCARCSSQVLQGWRSCGNLRRASAGAVSGRWLCGHSGLAAIVIAGAPGRQAHLHPAGGPVAGARKTRLFHEGLQQINGMSVLLLPIGR